MIERASADPTLASRVRTHSEYAPFIASLRRPRVVLLLVPAGRPVDNVLDALLPLLSKGDVVVDHGNSHADDTERRQATTAAVGVHFVGCGTSGGEQGARVGPCLMPGGSFEAWKVLQPVLEPAAAVVKGPPGATPHPGRRDDLCVAYVG